MLSKFQTKEITTNCINHLSDIDFQDFMNHYKRCTAKRYSFLVIATLASYNFSHFRNNLSEGLEELMMTIDDKIRMENYNIILPKKPQNISIII